MVIWAFICPDQLKSPSQLHRYPFCMLRASAPGSLDPHSFWWIGFVSVLFHKNPESSGFRIRIRFNLDEKIVFGIHRIHYGIVVGFYHLNGMPRFIGGGGGIFGCC